MTMAESAVEDAAAAPPGPAKPPPPSCTNNNTLAATANRNHRPLRKRRRLNQVLDDLQAHKSLPSEAETLPMRFDTTSLASEEEEENFGSPRSSSRSASDNAIQSLSKRLKAERLETTTDEETPPGGSHLTYQPYYPHNHSHNNYQDHYNRRCHNPAEAYHQNHQAPVSNQQQQQQQHTYHQQNLNSHQISALHQQHRHPSSYHKPPHKFRGCPCPNCANPSLSLSASAAAAAAAMLLPSPTSPLAPLTPLTPLTPLSLTPLTPVSPSSYSFEHYLNTKYLPASEVIRKRSNSDSEVPGWEQRPPSSVSSVATNSHTPRSGSLESDVTSPQESPLDLSMKNLSFANCNSSAASNDPSVNINNNNNNNNSQSVNNNNNSSGNSGGNSNNNNRPAALQLLPTGHVTRGSVSVPVVRGDVASPTTKESVASRYNLEVSPVVEEMPPGADVAYVCPVCGQMFSLHDRLAKHMASRHRRQGPRDASAKAYRCDVCKRSFARSDMLTRHMRLHTGVKPYTCKVCNQVFSRSDHLSTHQRTHTGEKPYKCPQCVYAACRRDMITRHLRTHAKPGSGQQAIAKCEINSGGDGSVAGGDPESPSYGLDPMGSVVKME